MKFYQVIRDTLWTKWGILGFIWALLVVLSASERHYNEAFLEGLIVLLILNVATSDSIIKKYRILFDQLEEAINEATKKEKK